MRLFAATCLAFAESNIANQMERFRREAGYEAISFIDSKSSRRGHLDENQSFFSEESRAWGAQSAEPEYEKKGEIITIDDLDMYVVGDGPNGNVPCFTSGILEYSVQQSFGIIIFMVLVAVGISNIPTTSPTTVSLLCCRTFFVAKD